jgi:hypothetical protein
MTAKKKATTNPNPTKPLPKKPAKSSPSLKLEDIERELIEARGNISHAARQLGCARYTVQAWINRTPQLQQVLKDQREAMIDQAENALVMAIEQLQGWAVCFALKCLGKERGYVETQQVQQSGAIEVIVRREDRRNTTSEN